MKKMPIHSKSGLLFHLTIVKECGIKCRTVIALIFCLHHDHTRLSFSKLNVLE